MATPSFCCRKEFGFILGVVIFLAHGSVLSGQSVAPAPKVDPIVDPLTEMGPSANGEKKNGEKKDGEKKNGEKKDDILGLDIEQLGKVPVEVPAFDIEVTSVAKQESTVGKSPAAVFVITNEMIRRSTANCIPELLRLAPGVEVARLGSHDWCISIRGFNDRYSNKLLVLVDGRSVYSQMFSGVFWDQIDMPLDDIERIEVIRGPGGTLWGANAVNGVINIISKQAKDTQGALVDIGGGSQDYNITTFRYGSTIGKNVQYRVWGKYFDRGPEYSPGNNDAWNVGRGGFYADWNPGGSRKDLIHAQGNFFGGKEGIDLEVLPALGQPLEKIAERRRIAESSFLLRWEHTIDEESDWAFQTYWDQTCRYDPRYFGMTFNTFDFDFQYRRPFGRRHSVITGVEYNQTHDFLRTGTLSMTFDNDSRSYYTFSGFVQDEIELADDRFYVTIGSKLETNTFTGFEYQPSVRALWAIDKRHVLWGAISRAVRTPSRFEENAVDFAPFDLFPNSYIVIHGSEWIKSEDVVAYELGYRAQTNDKFSWDISLFFNQYESLMGFDLNNVDPVGPYTFFNYGIRNNGRGEAYGFEWTANWQATKTWRLAGSYSFLVTNIQYFGEFATPVSGDIPTDPRNQIRLQSYWNFAPHWQFDAYYRYVDRLAANNTPSYMTMDLRLGYRPNKNLDVSIIGQNLFCPHHLEFMSNSVYGEPTYEINRAVYARLTWMR